MVTKRSLNIANDLGTEQVSMASICTMEVVVIMMDTDVIGSEYTDRRNQY